MKKTFYIFLILFLFSKLSYSQAIDSSNYVAQWIFNNILPRVTWPDEDKIDTFNIVVYGKNTDVTKYLRQLAKQRTIKGKHINVMHVYRIGQIPLQITHVIYVERNRNDYVPSVKEMIGNLPILLITYQSKDRDYFMINFTFRDKNNQFEVNSFNIKQAGLKLDEALLKLGGTKVDVQGLLRKKELQLIEKEKALNRKQDSLIKQRKLLAQREQELNKLRAELDKKRLELAQKEKQLEEERQKSGHLSELIGQQEGILKRNELILQEQNKQIQEKQELIKKQTKEIKKRQKEIKEKELELREKLKEIEHQKRVLRSQKSMIKSQRIIIIISIIFSFIVLGLLGMIFRSYNRIRRLNEALREKNDQIERQKSELELQARQLEEFNKELEKLSLVAARTDNSVIIMDKDGNFEWVNPGFTRLYGYTLQLLINEVGKNIREISGNPKIEEYIDYCIKNKTTVTYEVKNHTRDGRIVWVQTSLTPILNEKDEVVKLFAIETNITKLKEQEREIRQKNEELKRQRDILQEQKEQIEMQNKLIKDSIRYAKTIQAAILPPKQIIDKYFDNFIIYLPRDIVSGDFYWFTQISESRFFMAVVDCTGHGVPGAFMSLIASRMLSEIILEKRIYDPKEILNVLNETVIETLNQRHTDNNDGMDVCLVRVDKAQQDKYQVVFSGAKRPLFYYRRSEGRVNIIKGSRKPIGGIRAMQSPLEYENYSLVLEKNDVIYLTSDGMIDQNNPKRKRFGTPRFLDLLNEVKDFDLEKQNDYIQKVLRDYMKNEPQRDDITIMGVMFK